MDVISIVTDTKAGIDEKTLSKGELRKLNALRKSLGQDIADDAFSKWYESKRKGKAQPVPSDRNIEIIREALESRIDDLKFPRGGSYVVRRGRGRIIVESA